MHTSSSSSTKDNHKPATTDIGSTSNQSQDNNTSTTTITSNMSTSTSSSPASETTYYLVPNLQALDPSARELDAAAHSWVQATVIEDEDLTFGGKSLSAWYEEDRRRFSHSEGEEEKRGRERVRRNYSEKSGSNSKH